ncbi:hypothetical protein GCM10027400_20920 [Pseudoxanthomonas daejeonensis]
MSQHHRRELIEQSFATAERQTGPVLDLGIGRYGFAYRQVMDTRLEDSADRQEVEVARNQHVFREATKHISQVAEFDDQSYFSSTYDSGADFSHRYPERLGDDRLNAMDDWISQHSRAQPAVDEYCSARAREDLANQAQVSRPQFDLASPDEYKARRSRGRSM